MSKLETQEVASLVPDWLETEMNYANAKYDETNPQLTALYDGVKPGTQSFSEFEERLKRFDVYFNNGDRSVNLLLLASQSLGKWLNTGQALQRVIAQNVLGIDRFEADKVTLELARMHLPKVTDTRAILDGFEAQSYFRTEIEPRLDDIDYSMIRNPRIAASTALGLVVAQSKLFIEFTTSTGVIAQPGLPSGEVEHWEL